MKYLRSLFITLILGMVIYYFSLPAINLQNMEFWIFIFVLVIIFVVLNALEFSNVKFLFQGKRLDFKKYYVILFIPVVILGIIVVNFLCSPLFNARSYQRRITVDETANFLDDVEEVDFNHLPLLDRDSSEVLGDRVMGQMSDLVSQFDVSNIYTQINYNDTILRVTPLEYNSVIKWFTNRKSGVPGYITVNSVNGESNLVRLDKGMKYVPSALFNENLYRKLRFKYLTTNFGSISFEIDNEGNPYWIVPTISYTGVDLKAKVTGVIIMDPMSGDSKRYDLSEIPTWVDVAYSADLIIEQLNDWGNYKNGYWNSIFGQKGVVNTTDGYNYLAMNDDIYLYTGITSVVSDESNLGFVLSNMRTGETKYYSVSGAEEYSAMHSAEGQVQDMGYNSTFPLLINLNNKPTYLVSLKDSSGLVKMYGFVDVEDYQKVVVTDASKGIVVASENYLNNTKRDILESELIVKDIEIKSISVANIGGYSYYYIIDSDNIRYKASITLSDNLPFLKVLDKLKIAYVKDAQIINIEKVY